MKRKNKKFALIFLLIVFLGIASPFKDVLAIDASTVPIAGLSAVCPLCSLIIPILQKGGGAIADVGSGVFNFFISIISLIPSTLLWASQALLSWVISPNFLGISMTGPDNIIVSYGWSITRDLANIFLLLGLVVIGLGIILGIEEYQAKKTLPRLIAIALLINFTLVICGFILDFANLLMSYFLGAGSLHPGFANEIQSRLAESASKDYSGSTMTIIIYFIFGMIAAMVYFLYALLFIARYVYLWILIIIAPIAFITKVFPVMSQAKQFFPSFFHWDEWWRDFIRWSVVGIYAAFFIALANRLMVAMASGTIMVSSPGILGNLFSYIFPIVLLLIGFFSILETGGSVPGFKQVVSYGKTAAIGAAAVTTGALAGAYVGGAAVDEDGNKRRIRERIGGVWQGAATPEGREKGRKALYKTAERVPFIGPKPGTYEAGIQGQASEEAKRLEKVSDDQLNYLAYQKTVLTKEGGVRRAAALNELVKRGKISDANIANAKNSKVFTFNEGEALKRMPQKVKEVGSKKTIEEVIARQTPADFAKNIQAEAFKDDVQGIDVYHGMSPNQLKALMEKGSEDKKQALVKLVKKNVREIADKVDEIDNAILSENLSQNPDQVKIDGLKKKKADLTEKIGYLVSENYL